MQRVRVPVAVVIVIGTSRHAAVRDVARRSFVPWAAAVIGGAVVAFALVRAPALLPLVFLPAVAAGAIVAPRWFLLAAIPLVVLAGSVPTTLPLEMLVVAAAGGSWALGLVQRRWSFVWRVHGPIAALAVWLLLTSRLHPAAGGPDFSPASDLRTLLLGLLLCAVAASVRPDPARVIAVTVLTVAGIALHGLMVGGLEGARHTALGLNPNYLGVLLAVGLSGSTALALSRSLPRWRVLWIGSALVQLLLLLQTRSRGAYMAAGAGLVIAAIVGRPWRTKVAVTVATVFAVLLLPGGAMTITGAALEGRSTQELELHTALRSDVLRLAGDYSFHHPLTGIGYGRFAESARGDDRLGITINTHNDYLRLSAESGLLGLALLIALVSVVRRLDPRRGADRAVLATVGTYLVGILFANTLSNLQVTAPIWVLLGCAATMGASPGARRRLAATGRGRSDAVGDGLDRLRPTRPQALP